MYFLRQTLEVFIQFKSTLQILNALRFFVGQRQYWKKRLGLEKKEGCGNVDELCSLPHREIFYLFNVLDVVIGNGT